MICGTVPEVVDRNDGLWPCVQNCLERAGDPKTPINQHEIKQIDIDVGPRAGGIARPFFSRGLISGCAERRYWSDVGVKQLQSPLVKRARGGFIRSQAINPCAIGFDRDHFRQAKLERQRGASASAEFKHVMRSRHDRADHRQFVRMHGGPRQCNWVEEDVPANNEAPQPPRRSER